MTTPTRPKRAAKKGKPATTGESLVLRRLKADGYDVSLNTLRCSGKYINDLEQARAFDAAIRRAVRDHKQTLASLAKVKYAVDCGAESIEVEHAIRDRFEAKYGVRP